MVLIVVVLSLGVISFLEFTVLLLHKARIFHEIFDLLCQSDKI